MDYDEEFASTPQFVPPQINDQAAPETTFPETEPYETPETVTADVEESADPEDAGIDVIKVSARSRSTAVAGAIAWVIRQYHHAEVQAIGAGAVNQAVKAMAIARLYLSRDDIDIIFIPCFMDVDLGGLVRTAVRFSIEARKPVEPADVVEAADIVEPAEPLEPL